MRRLWRVIPVIAVLLASCTTLSLRMKVDPALEANAEVYEVTYPGSLSDIMSDNKLNVSFGPYRVTDADAGWKKLRTIDDTEPDVTISGVSQSLSYTFKAGDEIAWDARCSHVAEKRETREDDKVMVDILSSKYTCRYRGADNEVWTLSVEDDDITLRNKEQLFSAHATGGEYVASDGRPYETSALAGYTWTQDNNTIAAISVGEKIPRVWLERGNSEAVNDVLAMASTGLLIYYWEIVSTL